jgi:serine/threonine protein kinase
MKKYGDYIEVKIGDLRYAEKLQSGRGTSEIRRPRWSPLEALENYGGVTVTNDLLKQADVYSFAMTCYEIVTGNLPYQNIQGDELTKMIKEGQRPELPEDLKQSGLRGLIESCWANHPNSRPVFEHICAFLDTIRSSMSVVTNKSSGKVSRTQKFFLRCFSTANSQSTTWESKGTAEIDIIVPECPVIKHEALSKVRTVGRGASAKVYEVKWMGCTFAMKRFNRTAPPGYELNFLIQLRHPYIIQLVGLSADKKGRRLIVMEYMKGSLRDLINTRISNSSAAWKPRDSIRVKTVMLPFKFGEEVLSIMSKLAQGMTFLHSRGLAHRDLKAKNVLCQEHAGYFDVKIVDFGESQILAEAGRAVGVGTTYWRAPEILPKPANTSRECSVNLMAADVYSFAMTCYEIVTGLAPFFLEFENDITKNYHEVVDGRRPELPDDLDAGLKNLIEDCWHSDPARRPKFVQICTRLNDLSPLV